MKINKLLLILGMVISISLVESIALYNLQSYNKQPNKKYFYIIGSAIYGIIIPFLLVKNLKYEGVGMMNFLWNIMSTFIGFTMGILFFGEKIENLQLMGILITLLGLGMVLLGDKQKDRLTN